MAVKVFREFGGQKPREKWPLAFDLEGVERDHKVRQQLQTQQQFEEPMSRAQATNFFVGGASVDINKPPREAYNPRDPKNEYPKMLHHQTKKDPNWLKEHKRLTLYNSLHPEKPELLPAVPYAFVIVNNKQEEEAQLKQGFGFKPPAQPEQAEEFAELAGEVLCSRGCGAVPHRGSCKPVAVSA